MTGAGKALQRCTLFSGNRRVAEQEPTRGFGEACGVQAVGFELLLAGGLFAKNLFGTVPEYLPSFLQARSN